MIDKIFRLLVIIGICCLMNGSLAAYAEDRPFSEYEVKAAFLFNFAKFVEWPENAFSDPDAPITFCILGEDPFGSALDSVKDKTIKGRKVLINRFKDVQDIRVCHILFISSSEKDRLTQIMRSLKHSKILLIGDVREFAQQGGVINFIMVDNKVGFEINVDAARRASLKISSKLLNLAKIIHDTTDRRND